MLSRSRRLEAVVIGEKIWYFLKVKHADDTVVPEEVWEYIKPYFKKWEEAWNKIEERAAR